MLVLIHELFLTHFLSPCRLQEDYLYIFMRRFNNSQRICIQDISSSTINRLHHHWNSTTWTSSYDCLRWPLIRHQLRSWRLYRRFPWMFFRLTLDWPLSIWEGSRCYRNIAGGNRLTWSHSFWTCVGYEVRFLSWIEIIIHRRNACTYGLLTNCHQLISLFFQLYLLF